MKYRKFNISLTVSVPFTIAIIMIFNYTMDPYFIFNSPQIEGVNKIKNNEISTQTSKFYTAKRSNAKILLIGTSRTEHIHPKYLEKYFHDKIYNLGLPGSGIGVQKTNIEYFVKKAGVKTIIMGLDFFSFNPKNVDSNMALHGTRYQDDYSNDYLDALLSIKTLRQSIKTLKDNRSNKHPTIDYTNGWRTYEDDYIQIAKHGNDYIKLSIDKQIKAYSSKIYNFNYPPFKRPDSITKPLNELKEIVEFCKNNGVALYLFISPVYCEITDLIYSRGYNQTYHHWKKELANYGNIYDFSGYNSITTDMSNYVDGSHYQTKLAKIMFARMFNDSSVKVPDDFGIVLTTQNIDEILSKQEEKARHKK